MKASLIMNQNEQLKSADANDSLRRVLSFLLEAAGDAERAQLLDRLPEVDAAGWSTHWLHDLPWVSTAFFNGFQDCERDLTLLRASLMGMPCEDWTPSAAAVVSELREEFAGVHARRKDNLAPEQEQRILVEGAAQAACAEVVLKAFETWSATASGGRALAALKSANSVRDVMRLRPQFEGKPEAENLEKTLALCKLEELLMSMLLARARHCNDHANAVRPAFDYASKHDSDGNEIERTATEGAFESAVTADEMVWTRAQEAYCYLHGWSPRLPETGDQLVDWFRGKTGESYPREADIPMRRFVAREDETRHLLMFLDDVLSAGFRADITRGVAVTKVSADAPVCADDPEGETVGARLADEHAALPFEELQRQDDLCQVLRVRNYLLRAIGQFDAKLYRFCRLVWDEQNPCTAKDARVKSGIGESCTNYVSRTAARFLQAVAQGHIFLPKIEEDRELICRFWARVK